MKAEIVEESGYRIRRIKCCFTCDSGVRYGGDVWCLLRKDNKIRTILGYCDLYKRQEGKRG